ncbi:chaperone protein HscA [Rhodoferax lithotrophicus]|uniref:Chaperone protein HscA n=1 Tax=Rhodoferax lithotrophicus TaxID=2798804 RepID=A0ABN6DB53_9BURK|nr:Hsp70 family protein [Rhodoferax sp. MIZ03]BCO29242.1 chaperone protein HscA [Rhodoferax sp. MIZ03]
MSQATFSRPVLGIDFGTSNSAAALVDAQGQLHPITLEGTRSAMPTALYFSNEDGQLSFGTAAMQQYLTDVQDGVGAGRLMRAIKSLLGSTLINEQTVVNGRSLSFFEIVVLFFRELKHRAETQLGYGISAAMLGRPVHFVDDNPERDALAQATLQRAAHAAGFTQVAFEMEPIAAAFDFERRITADTQVLVADIGGGTSDFTMIQLHAGSPRAHNRSQDILATRGIHLGGTDFDRLLDLACVMPLLGYGQRTPSGRELPNRIFYELATWHLVYHTSSRKSLAEARELWHNYTDQAQHQRLMHVLTERLGHQLLAMVELAKISCSESHRNSPINLSGLSMSSLPTEATAVLDPPTLQQVLQKPLSAITACACQCVAASGLQQPEVIYLTGGSSALSPLVDQLTNAFPHARIVHGDRFGGVANGLAWAAQCDTPDSLVASKNI